MDAIIKILIVEDEVLIAFYIQEMLLEDGYSKIELAHDFDSTLTKMAVFQPDIILMDINLGGQDKGIELAKLKNSIAKIIYVTAQTEERTIQKAIETTPETYLTKPIKKTDLLAAVKLASFKKSNQFIIIKDGHNEVKIELDTILYIKSENIYIDIFTKIKKYTIRKTLDSFLKELNHPHFCKTHRSYIVNKTLITKISSKFVYLNDIAIPLSKTYNIKY